VLGLQLVDLVYELARATHRPKDAVLLPVDVPVEMLHEMGQP
jgi:hypothetical protein